MINIDVTALAQIEPYMNDEFREQVHFELAPCTAQECKGNSVT